MLRIDMINVIGLINKYNYMLLFEDKLPMYRWQHCMKLYSKVPIYDLIERIGWQHKPTD